MIKFQLYSASSERPNNVAFRHRRERKLSQWRPHKKWVWRLNSVLLTLGLLWSIWLLPHVQAQPATASVGGRGGVHLAQAATPTSDQKTCGQPTEVFQTLGLATMHVPDTATLSLLPTPQQHPVTTDGDISYDPHTNELCAVGWQGLATRYGSFPPTTLTTSAPDTGGLLGSTGTSWVQSILNGLFSSFAQTLNRFLSGVLSWAKSFGFMFITPDALTYNQPVVSKLNAWMVGVVDSVLVLLLVIGGYQALLGQNHLLKELAPRFLLSGIAATGSLFFLTQCIEVQNQLCLGFQAALATAGVGNLTLPLGVINWGLAPLYEALTYLIDVLMSVLLCLQMLVRIGLLDFLIILSPLGFHVLRVAADHGLGTSLGSSICFDVIAAVLSDSLHWSGKRADFQFWTCNLHRDIGPRWYCNLIYRVEVAEYVALQRPPCQCGQCPSRRRASRPISLGSSCPGSSLEGGGMDASSAWINWLSFVGFGLSLCGMCRCVVGSHWVGDGAGELDV